jgi:hypothetical protein
MSTVLYNTTTNTVIGNFTPHYIVDGLRPILDGDIIELNIISANTPEVTPTQTIKTEWQVQGNDYVQVHTVINKTEAELLEEKIAATPKEITKRQMLLFMYSQMGVTNAQINSMIDTIADTTQRELLKIEWEFATVVDRTNPNVVAFAAMMGINESQLIDIFYASKDI